VKVGLSVTNYSWPDGSASICSRLAELAFAVEDAGLDTLWVSDHLLQMDPTATFEEPMLEAYTTLGFLAAVTSRLQLGTMVTWATIRPPALLVKAVTTLDVLSRGRAWLGIGAGYQGTEAAMLGLPFEPTPERFARLQETLEIVDHMWSGNAATFQGTYYRLEQPINQPPPLHRPRILIGGTGERRTLPLVARYADACNLPDIPDAGATVKHKLRVLADLCERGGRDMSELEVTLSTRLAPDESARQFAERCAVHERNGIDQVVLVTGGPWQLRDVETIGRAVAELGGPEPQ
jgi:F420-dependent oxidoreductase-like protein